MVKYRSAPLGMVYSAPSRALNTVYQNTSGRPILVIVTMIHTITAVSGSCSWIVAYSDASSPPTTIVCRSGCGGALALDLRGILVFIVKSGEYYRLVDTTASATTTISNWVELTMLEPAVRGI